MRPCQGGLPGRLSEFKNVPCRHFLIVLSEVRVAVGYIFNSTAVCCYFIWVLSLLFGPCRLSEITLAGPHLCRAIFQFYAEKCLQDAEDADLHHCVLSDALSIFSQCIASLLVSVFLGRLLFQFFFSFNRKAILYIPKMTSFIWTEPL